MIDKVSKYCGFYDYLQTKNLIEVEEKIEKGNNDAKLIMEAFIYQVSKEISMYGATLKSKINKIILTGGISNSNLVVEGIKERVNYLADVEVVPGEMEMKALALGAIRVLEGYEKAKIY